MMEYWNSEQVFAAIRHEAHHRIALRKHHPTIPLFQHSSEVRDEEGIHVSFFLLSRFPDLCKSLIVGALLIGTSAVADVCVESDVTYGVFTNCVRIGNADAEVVVAPGIGRVLHYGRRGGPNLFWTNPSAPDFSRSLGGWKNWGGEKTWIWPQDGWAAATGASWPPPAAADNGPYGFTLLSDGVRMVSPVVSGYGVRVVKEITMPTASGMKVDYETWLEPTGSETNAALFSVWTIVQVPLRGAELFARVSFPERDWVKLGSDHALPKVTRIGTSNVVRLKRDKTVWMKSGTEGDAFAVRRGGTVFTLTQSGLGEPSDIRYGDRLQVCTSPDVTPCFPEEGGPCAELEFTMPTAPRDDVAQHKMHVVWDFMPVADKATDEDVAALLFQK